MNAEEAINEVKAQAEAGVKAFQVLSMQAEDVEMYGDKELKQRFATLNDQQKDKLLSLLMDEVHDTLETSEWYGFKKLIEDTLGDIDAEDRREELYMQAEREA